MAAASITASQSEVDASTVGVATAIIESLTEAAAMDPQVYYTLQFQ